MIPITKRHLAPVLILSFTVLTFIAFFTGRDSLRLKTFRSETGWGYCITTGGKVVIWQPYIPAVEGKRPFGAKIDARRAGKIMINKINKGIEPFLTTEELQRAGIRL